MTPERLAEIRKGFADLNGEFSEIELANRPKTVVTMNAHAVASILGDSFIELFQGLQDVYREFDQRLRAIEGELGLRKGEPTNKTETD